MLSRNDPDGPYWWRGKMGSSSPTLCEFGPYHISRSFRRTETVLSRINRDGDEPCIDVLLKLPGCGDTAFPSIVRVDKTRFLVANYSSPLDAAHEQWSWIHGQFSYDGTQIHLYYLEFK